MTKPPDSEPESSGRFHVLRRGNSVRTKPAQRVPGSPVAYMPAPLHPVNDADIQAMAEEAVAQAHEKMVEEQPKAKLLFVNFGSVLHYAAAHNREIVVHVKGLGTMKGVPRHEHVDFWSIAESWGRDILHRQFFFMGHVIGVETFWNEEVKHPVVDVLR